jgi:hypothetical protein
MTGVEAGLGIAGKFLAPYAGKVSISLAKRAIYRRRIDWAVGKGCTFNYPRRRFRRWLKTVSKAELSERVETAGPRLAVRLEKSLAPDASWSARPDRTSLALQMVEATYVAILRLVDPGLGRQLGEQWTRQRNEEMVAGLVQISRDVSLWTIADADLAVWLRRRSKERRRIRLAAFDVNAEAIALSLSMVDDLVPVIEPGSFRVLVGPFGAGKSEIAEAWHLQALDELGDDGPLPVWIHARDVATGGGLDRAVGARVGLSQITSRGVQVVIDGLDEVDGTTADGIAMAARVLVAGSPRSSVLATARRGVLPVTDSDIDVDGLSADAARSLVNTLSGGRHNTTWDWTPQLVESIRRPFFASAAGSLLATGGAPIGQAGLIKHLVERALRVGSSAGTMTSDSLYKLLVKLAASLTESNGASDGLAFRERQQAVSTRLVNGVEGESVTFALPVFEQWFAAQALLATPQTMEEALTDPRSFDRWRWAIAIAVMSGDDAQVDDLIEACLRMNPGAGAWVVAQVAQGRRRVGPGDGSALDASTSPGRLLRASRTWVDTIGDLAAGVFPVASAADPIRLGTRMHGDAFDHAWCLRTGPIDEVVTLPDSVAPFAMQGSDWVGLHAGRPLQGSAWPWETRRDDIARNILSLLEDNLVLGPDGGLWQLEARYRVARIVNRSRSALHPPLNREATIHVLENMLTQVDGDILHARFVIDGKSLVGVQIADLRSWLESQTFTHFERPLPTPDKGFAPGSSGSWIWDIFSTEQLVRFTSEVYGNACQVYDDMADTWFASFGWSLGKNACRPFGVLGKVKTQSGRIGNAPGLEYVELPMDILGEEIRNRTDLTVSSNGRAAIHLSDNDDHQEWWELPEGWTRIRHWADRHHIESPFWGLSWSSTVIECTHDRPASLQAATWMWNDLKQLNLTSGTFPQLS